MSFEINQDQAYLRQIVSMDLDSYYQFVEKMDRSCSCLYDLFHSILGRPHLLTKSLRKVDTEAMRERLKQIAGLIFKDCHAKAKDFKLLNDAITTFNKLVPNHALSPVYSPFFKELVQYTFATIQQKLLPLAFTPLTQQDFETLNHRLGCPPNLTYSAEHFQKLGGRIFVVNYLKFADLWEQPIGISRNDHLYTVCHQGRVRSQILNLALKIFKREAFKLTCGHEHVYPPHGIVGGYDGSYNNDENYLKNEFEDAFGLAREKRFGYPMIKSQEKQRSCLSKMFSSSISGKSLTKYFDQRFYSHSNNFSFEKFFFSFAETGFTIMQRFIDVNKNKTEFPLRGISIVIIPEGDWISYAKIYERTLIKLQRIHYTLGNCKEMHSPKPRDLEKSFWKMFQGAYLEKELLKQPRSFKNFQWPDEYDEALNIFLKAFTHETGQTNPRDHDYQNYFKTLAYRMAFVRLSSLVQPVNDAEKL